MEVRPDILALILGCMAVTLVPRIIPMLVVNKITLPRWFLAWLHYIPISVLSALFFKEVLLIDSAPRAIDDPYLLAGLLTLALAFVLRNLFLTVAVGAAIYLLLKFLLG